MRLKSFILLSFSLLLLIQCRKDEQFTTDSGAKLEFSADTVLYDTIFTTLGSITKRFTVYNRNDQAISISQIALVGGQASPFRINVDGSSGLSFSNVEILGKDSLFVFVEATLDANNQSNPLIIEDHIAFLTNGNQQEVLLIAWGQDAEFHVPTPGNYIFGFPWGFAAGATGCDNVTWTNDKPHVIFGYTVVDSCSVLTIEPGTRVHFHNNSGMLVWRYGQLIANGTVNDRIRFEGDRLQPLYDDLPGQWDRIWILDGNTPSEFNHVEIKNSLVGLQVETAPWMLGLPTNAPITLNNTNIQNCSAAGLLTRNYGVQSSNLLVANCGQSCIALQGGGEYHFDHTTVGNYWSYDIRQTPAFSITNLYLNADGNVEIKDIVSSDFRAGIIWGNNADEFETNFDAAGSVSYQFDDYLIHSTLDLTGPEYISVNTNNNSDPKFVDPSEGDYHLEVGSAAIDGSILSYFGGVDLDGESTSLPNFTPELGCYEFLP